MLFQLQLIGRIFRCQMGISERKVLIGRRKRLYVMNIAKDEFLWRVTEV